GSDGAGGSADADLAKRESDAYSSGDENRDLYANPDDYLYADTDSDQHGHRNPDDADYHYCADLYGYSGRDSNPRTGREHHLRRGGTARGLQHCGNHGYVRVAGRRAGGRHSGRADPRL